MAENNTGHIYTVSKLTRKIKTLLEESFPFIWVTGEISNYATPASGHSYFTLKDSGAVISAVMFKNQKRNLKFEPENGMKIFGLARISLYEPRGSYQLIFEHLEPDGTGSLQVAFEQLKNNLASKGMFDEKHKKQIPFLPSKVCIVTSKTGAAIHDIVTIAKRRFPNCCLEILAVKVQGESADIEICDAIDYANLNSRADLIIIARGGGSLEDLAAFNSENVANAVFESEIPIISGVGHETDFTIADFVSDLRAPTPSAAAELAFPDKTGLQSMILKYQVQMQSLMQIKLNSSKVELSNLKTRLKTPVGMIYDARLKLEDLQERLFNTMNHHIQNQKEKLSHFTDVLYARKPESKINEFRQTVNILTQTLNHSFISRVQLKKAMLERLQTKLVTLNPESVLERGYSISRILPSRQVIKSAGDVNKHDKIQVILSQGELTARVEKTNGQKKNI